MRDKIEKVLSIRDKIHTEDNIENPEEKQFTKPMELIYKVLDESSFMEIDTLKKINRDNWNKEESITCGYGTIDGRLIYVYGQDVDINEGYLGELEFKKIIKIQKLALKMGAPILGILGSNILNNKTSVKNLNYFSQVVYNISNSSGIIPQILIGLGDEVNESISRAVDFSIQVIREDQADRDNLYSKVDYITQDKEEAIEYVKSLLSYLPSNNLDKSDYIFTEEDVNRLDDVLNDLIPNDYERPYDMRAVIRLLADYNRFFEIKSHANENMLIGYIRLGGQVIGVIANQPNNLYGSITLGAENKAARFLSICDAFNIPVLTLVDTVGFSEDTNHSSQGSKLSYAYSEATVPKVTIIVRKAYSLGAVVMGSKGLNTDLVFAWPNAKLGLNREYAEDVYILSEEGLIDDVLIPSETRENLIYIYDMLMSKRENLLAKKHGNMPL